MVRDAAVELPRQYPLHVLLLRAPVSRDKLQGVSNAFSRRIIIQIQETDMNSIQSLLQRRQSLSTIRALQSVLHPALQASRVEDMAARCDHVQSSSQHKAARNVTTLSWLDNGNLQVLHADRTIEGPLSLVLGPLVLQRVTTASRSGTIRARDGGTARSWR